MGEMGPSAWYLYTPLPPSPHGRFGGRTEGDKRGQTVLERRLSLTYDIHTAAHLHVATTWSNLFTRLSTASHSADLYRDPVFLSTPACSDIS